MRKWPLSLKLGLALFAVGSGPLALFLIADAIGLINDPDPNPIGLGLLFFITFWPAMGLILLGRRTLRDRSGRW